MTEEKKTRKSVPRQGSGRRGKDGAIGLKMTSVRLRPDQIEKFKALGGSALLRSVVDQFSDPSVFYVVELTNGNWHTITRVKKNADDAASEWNKSRPGTAMVREAYAYFP